MPKSTTHILSVPITLEYFSFYLDLSLFSPLIVSLMMFCVRLLSERTQLIMWKFRSLSNYILMFVLTFEMNMSNGKMSDFVSFPLFGYTLVKSEKCRFWKSMKYFSKKDMLSNSNMFNGKMSYFVSFPLLAFTLVIKLINFHFEGH